MESAGIDNLQALPVHQTAPHLYAGFWRRVAAWFIDAVIFSAAHVALTLLFGTWLLVPWTLLGGVPGEAMARFVDIGLQPFGVVLAWLYFAVCESSPWQATIGKLVAGLQVTGDYGQRIGFARATGRFFGKFISALFLCVGFLLAGWTARKQALHDFMAGCLVVRKEGLAAWRDVGASSPQSATQAAPPVAQPGIPGWAIALIVIGGSLFLVIPVLAIIAAIAIPAYQHYMVRAEVTQGLVVTERARALVGEYIGQRGALPDNNADLGLPKPETINARYVGSVRVNGGKIVVTYGHAADQAIRGGHVVMSPYGDAARLHWRCSSPDIDVAYLPRQCRQ